MIFSEKNHKLWHEKNFAKNNIVLHLRRRYDVFDGDVMVMMAINFQGDLDRLDSLASLDLVDRLALPEYKGSREWPVRKVDRVLLENEETLVHLVGLVSLGLVASRVSLDLLDLPAPSVTLELPVLEVRLEIRDALAHRAVLVSFYYPLNTMFIFEYLNN